MRAGNAYATAPVIRTHMWLRRRTYQCVRLCSHVCVRIKVVVTYVAHALIYLCFSADRGIIVFYTTR